MKLTFVFCLLAANVVLGQTIFWEEGKKLRWENFKSSVNKVNTLNVAAYSNCGWEYSVVKPTNPALPVKIEIKAVFNEDKSWKDTRKIDEYILMHEQRHFDIAELFVRKFRKHVAEKIINSGDYDRLFKSIYNMVSSEYKHFQTVYDRDTRHGMNEERQSEYNAVISQELENLKSYKNP